MKFLGFHIGTHDCNFTITNGQEIKYFKTERIFQQKHHGFESPDQLLKLFKKINLDTSSFDALACSTTPGPDDPKEKWPTIQFINARKKYGNLNYVSGFEEQTKNTIFSINHHLCHKLSVWPLIKTKKQDKTIVLDGGGSWYENTTVFQKNKIIEKKYWSPFLKEPLYENEILSFAVALQLLGERWGVKGHEMDIAGKMMSLQSFGNINKNLYKKLEKHNYDELHKIYVDIPKETDLDWLKTVHLLTEDNHLDFFKKYIKNNNEEYTYSGGTAQNIVLNTRLREWNKNIVIPPHCSDEGLSLGAVEFLRLYYKQPEFDNSGFPFWQHDEVKEIPTKETIKKVAEELANGKIVGWCQGKGEIGPRALGNRSILMRPDIENGKDIINNRVKHREPYRPFGCSVLLEDVNEYFGTSYTSDDRWNVDKSKDICKLYLARWSKYYRDMGIESTPNMLFAIWQGGGPHGLENSYKSERTRNYVKKSIKRLMEKMK